MFDLITIQIINIIPKTHKSQIDSNKMKICPLILKMKRFQRTVFIIILSFHLYGTKSLRLHSLTINLTKQKKPSTLTKLPNYFDQTVSDFSSHFPKGLCCSTPNLFNSVYNLSRYKAFYVPTLQHVITCFSAAYVNNSSAIKIHVNELSICCSPMLKR